MSDTTKLLKACVEYRAIVDRLETENAELRADKQRLDWLLTDDGGFWVNWMYEKGEWTPKLKASRDGIDAAKSRGHE